MDFQELGQTLKQERERQGLSIAVVMESTKISRTNIVAIENGDRSTLPHPVYAKGFIKSYARFLGLDADELSMAVDREYQDEADGPEERVYEVSPAAEKAFQEADSTESKGVSAWPMLLVALILVVAGVLVFMNFNTNDSEKPTTPPVVEEVQPEQAAPPSPAVPEDVAEEAVQAEQSANEAAPIQETQTEEAAAPAEELAPVVEEQPVVEAKSEPEVTLTPPVKPVEKEAEKKPEKQEYDHMLVIRATTEKGCWIGVWRGDEAEMSRDFVLQQGEPLRLMFNNPRRIRIGNVAGVSVTYNGKPYELSSKSNIQTIKFGY